MAAAARVLLTVSTTGSSFLLLLLSQRFLYSSSSNGFFAVFAEPVHGKFEGSIVFLGLAKNGMNPLFSSQHFEPEGISFDGRQSLLGQESLTNAKKIIASLEEANKSTMQGNPATI